VSAFVLDSRRLLREHYRAAHAAAGASGRKLHYPVTLPSMGQFRTTRRIEGEVLLTENEHGKRREDSIALVADWRKAGFVWEIPYGTLLPRGIKGLLTAGRCIASEKDAWEVTRVIPVAAATGEAAGVAAALAVQRRTTPSALEARDVQSVLGERGVPVHARDVGL